jgi:hypothetical protein
MRVPEGRAGAGSASKSNSFSGNERNRLVMGGKDGFVGRSLVSGVDCKEDARSYALLDFDQDGWVDIALASCNGPRLRFFRNRFGELGGTGRVVEVILRGSHTGSAPSTGQSNRDGVGAEVDRGRPGGPELGADPSHPRRGGGAAGTRGALAVRKGVQTDPSHRGFVGTHQRVGDTTAGCTHPH